MRGVNAEGVRMDLIREISSKLDSIGLMYRIFSRTKTPDSLEKKLESNDAYGRDRKIQDLIGVRVVLYFSDDVKFVRNIVSSLYSEKSKDVSIDQVGNDEFRAVRYNVIYSLRDDHVRILNLAEKHNYIDTTFELQIRTIFSEGWHEIEHDLRYKCKGDWDDFDGESRLLNGVYASLESSEWTMIKIFDELAYKHYKDCRWSAMLRQKIRLRLTGDLDGKLKQLFDEDHALAKKIFRVEREHLILEMGRRGYFYPITMQNIVYFINLISVNDPRILEFTPLLMVEDMSVIQG